MIEPHQPSIDELAAIAAERGRFATMAQAAALWSERVATIAPKRGRKKRPAPPLLEFDPFAHVGPSTPGAIAGKLVYCLRREAVPIARDRLLLPALRAAGFSFPQATAAAWIRRAREPWVRRGRRPRSDRVEAARILVASWRTLEWAGVRSVRRARELARALGATMRDTEATRVLAPFVTAADRDEPRRRNLRQSLVMREPRIEHKTYSPGTEN